MNPLYRQTQFLLGAARLADAPLDQGLEVAFAGRSNAGKSSALNAITERKALARTSKTPGRTQEINFFCVDERRRLVDLPGYGYAKASPERQKSWQQTVEQYLSARRSLQGLFLFMDIRHPLTAFDRHLIAWCRRADLAAHLFLTKSDKLGRGAAKTALLAVRRALDAEASEDFGVQLFSALDRTGVEEAHQMLDLWLGLADEK